MTMMIAWPGIFRRREHHDVAGTFLKRAIAERGVLIPCRVARQSHMTDRGIIVPGRVGQQRRCPHRGVFNRRGAL